MGIGALIVGTAAVALLLTGCTSDGSDMEGDCTIKVLRHEVLYRAVNVQRMPRPGSVLGEAVLADCDGDPLGERHPGTLLALPGTDPDEAVLLRRHRHDSVYVNESTPPSRWPDIVKTAGSHPVCDRPASFTGTWDLAGAAGELGSDYRIGVPYTGSFTARRGEGLEFDRWSRVELDARITDATDPQPRPRFLEQALADRKRVHVTTTCRGDGFEVSTIRLLAQSSTRN